MTSVDGWSDDVLQAIDRLDIVRCRLEEAFTDRSEAIRLLILASVCREHVLLIGLPGTAKTHLITHFNELIAARDFQYLLTRFTEPSELFGPLDVQKFKSGEYYVRTEGMLPDAEIVFLDEVFQGSSAILNSLLTVLNERVYHNGAIRQEVPLISLIGASNQLPDDPWLRAFADRFMLRLEVNAVADQKLGELLEHGWVLEMDQIETVMRREAGKRLGKLHADVTVDQLKALNHQLRKVDLSGVRNEYAMLIRELKAEGIVLSDRRIVKGQILIAGATLLRSAKTADVLDFWPLEYVWARPEDAETLHGVLQPRINTALGEAFVPCRAAADILDDLKTLVARGEKIQKPGAVVTHLTQMTALRREIINDHPDDTEARAEIENEIGKLMKKLEVSNV